ncbi:hypothetical protein EMUR_00360 [Ehrlichia muris AS145]|uniref:Uncharacterized protein n=1 Tax=Ehrlichia muris AS145 TaxID=1423892 RepID=V9RA49_9RICK|nr:hypothetical protein EMUR_00360 [Ehrlichia muris AS145]
MLLVFTVFIFITTCNFRCSAPIGFIVANHIAVTFTISMVGIEFNIAREF